MLTPTESKLKDESTHQSQATRTGTHQGTTSSVGANNLAFLRHKGKTENTKKWFSWLNISILVVLVLLMLWGGRTTINAIVKEQLVGTKVRDLAIHRANMRFHAFSMVSGSSLATSSAEYSIAAKEFNQTMKQILKVASTAADRSLMDDLIVIQELNRNLIVLEKIAIEETNSTVFSITSSEISLKQYQFEDKCTSLYSSADDLANKSFDTNSVLVWTQVLCCMLALPLIMILSEVGRIQEGKLQMLGELAVAEKVFDLNAVLLDPIGAKLLRNFAKSIFCDESLDFFYQASEVLKSAHPVVQRFKADQKSEVADPLIVKITTLIDRSVRSGSLKEINIESSLRDNIMRALESYHMSADVEKRIQSLENLLVLLGAARNEVFLLIKQNIYNPFVRSLEFEQFLSRRKRIYQKEMLEIDALLRNADSENVGGSQHQLSGGNEEEKSEIELEKIKEVTHEM